MRCECGGEIKREERPGAGTHRHISEHCASCGRRYFEVRNRLGHLLRWMCLTRETYKLKLEETNDL